ncbi:unnamed protein product [Nippostrongylus brasiliensis]|uniref:ShKT domain-containing protein n=1 Tax=Nippostrongylus brasiliensis TaxID=27835 RepID=A0A0N4YN97_NIPBR|nr:unnamed protein product [Nippostrongylus brasiliensis]
MPPRMIRPPPVGQCATNVVLMRRMCALSCGTCGLGGIGVANAVGPAVGIAPGIGYGGLAGAPLGAPILGRSIYEQGPCPQAICLP